ncbi:MAG: hypothetical protein WC976_06165 [Caldisericia bacterium]
MSDYDKRLNVPLTGLSNINLFTKAGLLIATAYERIVIGGRGPYVEFLSEHIIAASFRVPKEQAYRLTTDYVYYVEYRTNCISNVKAYFQRRVVNYADYRIGRWYVSPFNIVNAADVPLISPLRRKVTKQFLK